MLTAVLAMALAGMIGMSDAEFCATVAAKADGDIRVEERTSDDGVRGARFCGWVDAKPDEVYAVLTDYASFPKWLNKVEKTTTTRVDEKTIDVAYEMDFTFKTAKYVLRRVHFPAEREVRWTRHSGDFKSLTGRYHFLPGPEGKGTWLVMEQYADAGMWVPGFVRDSLQQGASRRLVDDVRAEVARRRKTPTQAHIAPPANPQAVTTGAERPAPSAKH